MSKTRNGRTRAEKRNAAALKAQRRQPCMRCGQPINYDAPDGDPDAFNAGHIEAWALRPDLRSDPSNLQPEHANCGSSAGKRHGLDNGIGVTSRLW